MLYDMYVPKTKGWYNLELIHSKPNISCFDFAFNTFLVKYFANKISTKQIFDIWKYEYVGNRVQLQFYFGYKYLISGSNK